MTDLGPWELARWAVVAAVFALALRRAGLIDSSLALLCSAALGATVYIGGTVAAAAAATCLGYGTACLGITARSWSGLPSPKRALRLTAAIGAMVTGGALLGWPDPAESPTARAAWIAAGVGWVASLAALSRREFESWTSLTGIAREDPSRRAPTTGVGTFALLLLDLLALVIGLTLLVTAAGPSHATYESVFLSAIVFTALGFLVLIGRAIAEVIASACGGRFPRRLPPVGMGWMGLGMLCLGQARRGLPAIPVYRVSSAEGWAAVGMGLAVLCWAVVMSAAVIRAARRVSLAPRHESVNQRR